jgi:hypothetical protein
MPPLGPLDGQTVFADVSLAAEPAIPRALSHPGCHHDRYALGRSALARDAFHTSPQRVHRQ